MDQELFMKLAKDYLKQEFDVNKKDMRFVWLSKVGYGNKAMIAVVSEEVDDRYFEVTYLMDKDGANIIIDEYNYVHSVVKKVN